MTTTPQQQYDALRELAWEVAHAHYNNDVDRLARAMSNLRAGLEDIEYFVQQDTSPVLSSLSGLARGDGQDDAA